MYTDPFGLCPDSLQGDETACGFWNARQLEKALAIIRAELARGNQYALLPDAPISATSHRDMPTSICGRAPQHTETGCGLVSNGQTVGIVVNVDRPPGAIALTIVHEAEHERTGSGEACPRARAMAFLLNMPKDLANASIDGFTILDPGDSSGCGF